MLIPQILILVLYIQSHLPQKVKTGITKKFSFSDMQLPRCYALAGENDQAGLGAKIDVQNCKTLSYYPKNAFTTQTMEKAAKLLHLESSYLIGYESQEEFEEKQKLKLFAVEFEGDFTGEDITGDDITSVTKNLSVIIHYNNSYLDVPHYYNIYGDDKISAESKFMYVIELGSWSSFPLQIQSAVQSAMINLFNASYEPTFQSVPQSRKEISSVPDYKTTFLVTSLTFIVQFIFVCISIQADKAGQLNALRLAGTYDIIYLAERFVFEFCIFLLSYCG